ncbi:MAG TPA: AIM24 family protein, partial [Agitococcus sp.]|nr:AIM24 family protein [Agitococcus sp.]
YTNNSGQNQRVAFAAPTVGKIIAVNLSEIGGELICQRGAFLAGEVGTEVKLARQKKIRVGFLGGEGFIIQRITGKGWVFINATGGLTEMHLAPNQTLQVDSGCWVASTSAVTYDIHYAGKVKTALFGGEGLFYASLTGPGTVWMQSLPMKRLSAELMSSAMTGRNRGGVWGRLYLIFIIIVIIVSLFGGR